MLGLREEVTSLGGKVGDVGQAGRHVLSRGGIKGDEAALRIRVQRINNCNVAHD